MLLTGLSTDVCEGHCPIHYIYNCQNISKKLRLLNYSSIQQSLMALYCLEELPTLPTFQELLLSTPNPTNIKIKLKNSYYHESHSNALSESSMEVEKYLSLKICHMINNS